MEGGQGSVWHGRVRSGMAVSGDSCRQQHRGLMLPLLLSLKGGRGSASFGKMRHGVGWSGQATVADGSTEGLGSLCCPPKGQIWPGMAGCGLAVCGPVGFGMV